MFSIRYARALLDQKARLLGSHAAIARQAGLLYRNYAAIRAGGYHKGRPALRLGHRLERWLRVRPEIIYVPIEMTAEEVDRRLALARRGTEGAPR